MPKKDKELQLNTQQKHFCIEYLKDWNGAQAAIRAGYSKKAAKEQSSRLLTNANIQEEIKEQIRQFLDKAKVPLEKKILDYWLVRAFYNIMDIVNLDGTLKLKEGQTQAQKEEELRQNGLYVCIDSINRKVSPQGIVTIQYKWADKDEAVTMLQKYIGMIKEEQPQIQQNNTYIDLKALIFNQAKNPKERDRIIAGLEELSDYKE